MKNFVLTVIFVAVVSAILQMFLAWYIIALVAFIAGYAFKQSAGAAFSAGFVAIFLLWAGYAFMLSNANNNLLAVKVATLLPLHGNVILLITITGIIGGLVSGLAALTGRFAATIK